MTKYLKKKVGAMALSMAIAAPLVAVDAGTAQAGPDPFLGEVMLAGFDFCPRGWAKADGQLLAISSNSALFSLYGTHYGGDGRTTFGLPDLRGRAPVHQGRGNGLTDHRIGEKFGQETVTLTVPHLPPHSHDVNATNADADKNGPGLDFLAKKIGNPMYHDGPPDKKMDPRMIGETGGGQPVENRSPSLVMNWCVALVGTFPSRN